MLVASHPGHVQGTKPSGPEAAAAVENWPWGCWTVGSGQWSVARPVGASWKLPGVPCLAAVTCQGRSTELRGAERTSWGMWSRDPTTDAHSPSWHLRPPL